MHLKTSAAGTVERFYWRRKKLILIFYNIINFVFSLYFSLNIQNFCCELWCKPWLRMLGWFSKYHHFFLPLLISSITLEITNISGFSNSHTVERTQILHIHIGALWLLCSILCIYGSGGFPELVLPHPEQFYGEEKQKKIKFKNYHYWRTEKKIQFHPLQLVLCFVMWSKVECPSCSVFLDCSVWSD